MTSPADSIAKLRLRIGGLTEARRERYRHELEVALQLPEGVEREGALRRLSARTLRAEALDRHPRMVRG